MLLKQLAQQRAVAARLIHAIAADREIGGRRQGGEQAQQARLVGGRHLGAIAPRVGGPALRSVGRQPQLHQRRAGRQLRQPEIVEVARRELGFAHAPRRIAHRSDAYPFPAPARASQTYDAHRHGADLLGMRRPQAADAVMRRARRSRPTTASAIPPRTRNVAIASRAVTLSARKITPPSAARTGTQSWITAACSPVSRRSAAYQAT